MKLLLTDINSLTVDLQRLPRAAEGRALGFSQVFQEHLPVVTVETVGLDNFYSQKQEIAESSRTLSNPTAAAIWQEFLAQQPIQVSTNTDLSTPPPPTSEAVSGDEPPKPTPETVALGQTPMLEAMGAMGQTPMAPMEAMGQTPMSPMAPMGQTSMSPMVLLGQTPLVAGEALPIGGKSLPDALSVEPKSHLENTQSATHATQVTRPNNRSTDQMVLRTPNLDVLSVAATKESLVKNAIASNELPSAGQTPSSAIGPDKSVIAAAAKANPLNYRTIPAVVGADAVPKSMQNGALTATVASPLDLAQRTIPSGMVIRSEEGGLKLEGAADKKPIPSATEAFGVVKRPPDDKSQIEISADKSLKNAIDATAMAKNGMDPLVRAVHTPDQAVAEIFNSKSTNDHTKVQNDVSVIKPTRVNPGPESSAELTKVPSVETNTRAKTNAVTQIFAPNDFAAPPPSYGTPTTTAVTEGSVIAVATPISVNLVASPIPMMQIAALEPMSLARSAEAAEWGNELGQRVNWMINHKQNSAMIRIDPPLLGRLDVQLQISDDATTITIQTQHAQTRDLIESASARLRDFLQESGYQNVNVDVSQRQEQRHPGSQTLAAADANPDDESDPNQPAGSEVDDSINSLVGDRMLDLFA